jgi:hypothetical protein
MGGVQYKISVYISKFYMDIRLFNISFFSTIYKIKCFFFLYMGCSVSIEDQVQDNIQQQNMQKNQENNNQIIKKKIEKQDKLEKIMTPEEKIEYNKKQLMHSYKRAEAKYGIGLASDIYTRTQEIHCSIDDCEYKGNKRHFHKDNQLIKLKDNEIYCEKCKKKIVLIEENNYRNTFTLDCRFEIIFYIHCDLCCDTFVEKIEIMEVKKNKTRKTQEKIAEHCITCYRDFINS